MLDLATASPTGRYTTAQLEAALRAGAGAVSCRFDVIGVPGITALTHVTAATVTWDVDRSIKGNLTLTMWPEPLLLNQTFRARIKPWIQIGMPDGGVAEWPLGLYIWARRPQRSIAGVGAVGDATTFVDTASSSPPDTWTVELLDQLWLLDCGGPAATGYTITAGTKATDAVIAINALVGITDTTGIIPSSSVIAADLTFDLSTSTGQPTTWRQIETDLLNGIGYYSPWFDLSGRPRATPTPDLTTVPSSVTYASGQSSILQLPITTADNVLAVANRSTARATSSGGFYGFAIADADVLVPGHPFSHGVIGVYIDAPPVQSSSAATVADLQALANADLLQRLAAYQTIQIRTWPWPVHEAFDIIGFAIDGDPDYGAAVRFHERSWSLDLFTGTMTHNLSRLS